MEIFFLAAFIVVVYIAYAVLAKKKHSDKIKDDSKTNIYQYTSKHSIMTRSEVDFFKMLIEVAGDRYHVFPQVHLSAILDHKIKGQNWKASFKHINGKSVDFVLCDKQSLVPLYAVELDDSTHQLPDRNIRDIEVERIFQAANLPLVRFSNYKSLSLEDIAQKFFEAHESKVI